MGNIYTLDGAGYELSQAQGTSLRRLTIAVAFAANPSQGMATIQRP